MKVKSVLNREDEVRLTDGRRCCWARIRGKLRMQILESARIFVRSCTYVDVTGERSRRLLWLR